MRRLFCLSLFLLLLVLTNGCLQPTVQKTTPTPTLLQAPVTTAPAVATTVAEKYLNFTVTKSEKAVTIIYNGGSDASDLQAMRVLINNQDGSNIKQTIVEPVIGFPYVFTYMGLANPVTVNIVGTFKGDYQQTVLMYYFP